MPKKKAPVSDEHLPDHIPEEEDGLLPGDELPTDAPAPEDPPDGDIPDGEAPDTPPDGVIPDAPPADVPLGDSPDDAAPVALPEGTAPGDLLDGPGSGGPADDGPVLLDGMAAGDFPAGTSAEEGDGMGALLQEMGSTVPLQVSQVTDPLTDVFSSGDEPLDPVDTSAPGAGEGEPPIDSNAAAPDTRDTTPTATPAGRDDYVLTIEARSRIETEKDREEVIWHEIRNSQIAGRILTGTLDGVEQTESGLTLAIIDYKGFRVAIPLKEMMLYTGKVPYGREYVELMDRLNRILVTMLGSEIDFIVRGTDTATRSVVASRKGAMLRKRQTFYMDTNDLGEHMIYEGRVVQARVVGVAEKVLRVEVFGVECAIFARDLSTVWFGDAREQYSVGDRVLVRVQTIECPDVEHITITADVRSVSSTTNHDNLKKLVVQSRYAGRVTDVRSGVVYIRLNNGCNAIAHTCYDRRAPGKNDDVSFAVTRLDEERGIAVGIITRIIKQNL